MDAITLLGLALALAMDAFAVALGTGTVLSRLTGRHIFRLAFHFGLFQALMPVDRLAGRPDCRPVCLGLGPLDRICPAGIDRRADDSRGFKRRRKT